MDLVAHGFNIYHDLVIKASLQKVFDAVSNPEHLNNWWTKECSGSPELGSEYNFHFYEKYNWFGKVITFQPNHAFYIKMIKADEDWEQTTFGFNLERTDNGTQVRFFHINWTECNHRFRHSSFCWALLLKNLKNYVEKGIIIPFEERD